jgi:hypothetical protein
MSSVLVWLGMSMAAVGFTMRYYENNPVEVEKTVLPVANGSGASSDVTWPNVRLPTLSPTECVYYFRDGNYDTHKAMRDGTYTFVVDGNYVVHDRFGSRKVLVKAGWTIWAPDWVIGESCGVFYESVLKQLGKK